MVLFYSGTGNSRWVGSVIASQTDDELICINDYIRTGIISPGTENSNFYSERPFVFVCPTYCWRMPRIVEDFIRANRFTGSKDFYFYLTCGDSTGTASKHAEKLCRELGFVFKGLGSVKMPENYIAMFDPPSYDEAQGIIRSAQFQVESAANHIKDLRQIEEPNSRSIAGCILSSANSLYYRFVVKDKHFSVSGSCISCGKCAELCPLANITLKEGKPVWNGNCTHCMACIGACPSNAIDYGKASSTRRRYYLYPDGSQKK